MVRYDSVQSVTPTSEWNNKYMMASMIINPKMKKKTTTKKQRKYLSFSDIGPRKPTC